MDILLLGKTPVSEESPAGEDITYSPEFEALQNEIDKLSIVSADAGEVDWDRVFDLSASLLGEKSKNLLVAAYMAEALLKTRRFEGLLQGSIIIKDLIENYWDTCFPPKKRKKGRLNALNWWYDRAGKFLKEFESPPLPREMIDETKQALALLDTLLSEKIDDAPLLRPLIQYVDRIPVEASQAKSEPPEPDFGPDPDVGLDPDAGIGNDIADPPAAETADAVADKTDTAGALETNETKPVPEPQPPPTTNPVSGPVRVEPDPAAISEALQSDKDAGKVMTTALDAMARLSTHYLKKDTANPVAYRLNRIYAWLPIDSLPMTQDGLKTPLPPPDPVVKTGIEKQLFATEYENAVLSAEARLRENRFWLDLNRFIARGLDALGDQYARAHDIVCRETVLFVKQLPGIETLKFSDGTSFADSETRAWLKSIGGGAIVFEKQHVVAGNCVDDASSSRHQEVEAEAGELVKRKKIVEAVHLFQESLVHCGSGRERLLFRIGLCRMLLTLGNIELVLPHLEALETEIDKHGLEDWEPELALQGLCLVYNGFRDCSREPLNKKAAAVFDRIARMNPAAAYGLCST